MEMDEAAASPFIENVRGEQVTFNRLLNDDYGAIENVVRQERIKFITGLIERTKLDGTDKFVAWRDNYTPWVDPAQVAAYLRTYDGAKKAVTMSLKNAGRTDEQASAIVAKFGFLDLSNLAGALLGFWNRSEIPQKGEATEPLRDPTPAPASL